MSNFPPFQISVIPENQEHFFMPPTKTKIVERNPKKIFNEEKTDDQENVKSYLNFDKKKRHIYRSNPQIKTLTNGKNTSTFYSTLDYLGEGGFSKIYKYSQDPDNKAIKKIMVNPKIYSKALPIEESVKREYYGMKICECEHIVKVYGVYKNKEESNYYIIMEQCDGNLEQLMRKLGRPFNAWEIREILLQLNEAFERLFQNNVIHRDIKPINILYKEVTNYKLGESTNSSYSEDLFDGHRYVFKLTDFGICLHLGKEKYNVSQFMGTLDYMAPEIAAKRTSMENPIYTTKVDLFTLGQSILTLLGYKEANKFLTEKTIYNISENCDLYNGDEDENLLADLLFDNLLVYDVKKRINWEIYFLHPFFDD